MSLPVYCQRENEGSLDIPSIGDDFMVTLELFENMETQRLYPY